MSSRRPLFALLTATLLPASAHPQSRFDFTRSLEVSELFDDNLFFRPSVRQSDFVSRLSPHVGAGYRSATLSVLSQYRLDAERFSAHPELSTGLARQEGGLQLQWRPTPRLIVASAAAYADTQTAGELNRVTGIELGRVWARRLYAAESLRVRLGQTTEARLDQSFTREQVSGMEPNDAVSAGVEAEKRLGRADALRVRYGVGQFAFGPQATTSHVLTLGLSREITPLAHLELVAGPRLSAGRVAAEVSASLRQRFRRGEAELTYLRTQVPLLGQPGLASVEGVTASFGHGFGRSFRVALAPAAFTTRRPGFSARVVRLGLSAGWRLTRDLELSGSHQFNLQNGGLARAPEEIARNTFFLRLVAGRAAP